MEKKHYETLIIGAGPAGLATAMELDRGGRDFIVIEKSSKVGGLAKTYAITEGDLLFRTDNGPHRFFSKNQYLYDFIGELLGDEWITVNRQTRQYIDGKFLDYPVNPIQVVQTLGPRLIARAAWDYLMAIVKYKIFRHPIKNFYDYAVANFGYTLANLNILGYTEKIWGLPTSELHADWARQRIKGLNLTSLVKESLAKLLRPRKDSAVKTLVDTFYYPKFGTGTIYESIKNRLEQDGREVVVASYPTRIHHNGGHIVFADMYRDGLESRVSFDYLVESIYLPEFLKLLDPLPPHDVLTAAANLKSRSQVHLFLTLDRDHITADQWLYFTDPAIPFARSSEMKNFSAQMCPPGKTSLWIEFFCDENDAIFKKSAEELLEIVLPYYEKFGFFRREDVRRAYRFVGGHDYPVYDLHYEKNLNVVKKYLDKFSNLYYIGRPGRFKYTNQDHSLEMGILAAKGVITGKRVEVELVGAEKHYFEQGSVKVHKRKQR